jgi:hypothetical protein
VARHLDPADQSSAEAIAQARTPVYRGPQPLPAGILPRRDRLDEEDVPQDSENFLGSDRGTHTTHLGPGLLEGVSRENTLSSRPSPILSVPIGGRYHFSTGIFLSTIVPHYVDHGPGTHARLVEHRMTAGSTTCYAWQRPGIRSGEIHPPEAAIP